MFTRVLVPLDGSDRAERALPVAVRLASASGGSLVLVRVATESFYAPATLGSTFDHAEGTGGLVAPVNEAEAYLKAVAARQELAGVPITTLAAIGTPAVEILEAAREHHVDAIVLCSHGRTGLAKWAMGSVAQKVARHRRARSHLQPMKKYGGSLRNDPPPSSSTSPASAPHESLTEWLPGPCPA